MKKILDACCGSKMFWFDKDNPLVTFCDNREENHILCDGRTLEIKPDIKCDFTNLPFEDNTYKLVVFDPPHIKNIGKNSWMAKKYGKLENDWHEKIAGGFKECFRVLENDGILIFKWAEVDITVNQVLKLTENKPLFGHKSGRLNKTHWLCFMKTKNV